MAACTSWPAASMLRSSANWIVICVRPWALVDVIESTPAIVENCFSSGVATADAMVSGLAPGRLALTWMVGKSTFGRDRKSTRLNSSHQIISYAVFCLKKKNGGPDGTLIVGADGALQ